MKVGESVINTAGRSKKDQKCTEKWSGKCSRSIWMSCRRQPLQRLWPNWSYPNSNSTHLTCSRRITYKRDRRQRLFPKQHLPSPNSANSSPNACWRFLTSSYSSRILVAKFVSYSGESDNWDGDSWFPQWGSCREDFWNVEWQWSIGFHVDAHGRLGG